jgi:phage terminase large subunit
LTKQPTTYYQAKKSKAKIQVHQGGSRSGKTFSLCQVIIELCFKNRGAGIVITIVRKTFPALRSSIMRDFMQILTEGENYQEENHNKSNATYNLFGNLIEFISTDQPQKLRGRKRNILYVNECNEITLEDWRQLLLRTTGRIFIDYNPSDEHHWIYEHILEREDVDFFQTTYLDNPFLEQSVIDEIERFKETDENFWRIYGLGERGVNTAAIFPQWQMARRYTRTGQVSSLWNGLGVYERSNRACFCLARRLFFVHSRTPLQNGNDEPRHKSGTCQTQPGPNAYYLR